jgi:hypothetical protein
MKCFSWLFVQVIGIQHRSYRLFRFYPESLSFLKRSSLGKEKSCLDLELLTGDLHICSPFATMTDIKRFILINNWCLYLMNTISVNQTEENFPTISNFDTILQDNKKTLFDKINKLKINEEIKEKIYSSFNDFSLLVLDKYNEDLEFFCFLKQLNKDLIFLESIKKVLVDKLILSVDDSGKYEEIEKSISK